MYSRVVYIVGLIFLEVLSLNMYSIHFVLFFGGRYPPPTDGWLFSRPSRQTQQCTWILYRFAGPPPGQTGTPMWKCANCTREESLHTLALITKGNRVFFF